MFRCVYLINFADNEDPTDLPGIRLVNGSNEGEGRLEIFHDGQWGTVCDDYFGEAETKVVCRMLGYE